MQKDLPTMIGELARAAVRLRNLGAHCYSGNLFLEKLD